VTITRFHKVLTGFNRRETRQTRTEVGLQMDNIMKAVQIWESASSNVHGNGKLKLEMESMVHCIKECQRNLKSMITNMENAVSIQDGVNNGSTDLFGLSVEQIAFTRQFLASVNPE
tara:strand:- start:270 stop:617 length:348 start_codon:yes stop_codon:yes gene_type:complete